MADDWISCDGEDSDVLVKERVRVENVETDDGSCNNVGDRQVLGHEEGDDKGSETEEGNDIPPGSGKSDDVYYGLKSEKSDSLSEVEDDPSSGQIDGTDGNEDQPLFFVGQTFSDLDELEKLKAKYEERHFCELWKRDVRTLEAAAKRVPKRVEIAKPSLKYYSLKLVCKFGGEARKRSQRIRKHFGKDALGLSHSVARRATPRSKGSQRSSQPHHKQDYL